MKKLCLVLVIILTLGSLAGCSNDDKSKDDSSKDGQVELTVVTPFSESDGNRQNYVDAYKAYEKESGNKINDVETKSVDESWKQGVIEDFRNGKEPDVINFFIGADADELIKNKDLVPISEIRKEYPDYASNMKESLMPVSTYDGQQYAVAVYGYWEGLFLNKKVLADCGVGEPGKDYTWDQFLKDCETIKDSGYTPIACSLKQIPHYWFEYCTFNNGDVATHTTLPQSADDKIGKNWSAGLNDIKSLYDAGYFPKNTNEVDDDTTAAMILDDKAAFLLDGSWKVGWFQENSEEKNIDVNNFSVTYFPSKGNRKPTDAIGGFSMGYSITRKAWEDPEKRDACVEFISAMTTDEVTSTFGELTVTALKKGVDTSGKDLDKLAQSTIAMTKGCTAMVPATQDSLTPDARDALFLDIPNVAAGKITAEKAIQDCLSKNR